MHPIILLLLLCLPVSVSATALAESGLKDYLLKALPARNPVALPETGLSPVFRDVELRVGADDRDFKSARLRFSPYGFGEMQDLKELTQKERDFFEAQVAAGSSLRIYEIAKMIVALYAQEKRLQLLQNLNTSTRQLISSYEKNLTLLAEKPEDYIKRLQEKLQSQKEIEEVESQIAQLRQTLAKEAGLDPASFSLKLDGLVNLDEIEKKVLAWSSHAPVASAKLRSMEMEIEKDELKLRIEENKGGFSLNYFDVGTSLKDDGSPDAPELGFGVSIPLFSGEYRARSFELKSSQIKNRQELEENRLQDVVASSHLKKQILYRVEQSRSEVNQVLLSSINRVQRHANEQMGAGSISSISIQLALAKLKLEQFDLEYPAWEEFVELAQILGELDPQGEILLSRGRS